MIIHINESRIVAATRISVNAIIIFFRFYYLAYEMESKFAPLQH